jgi:hypothetical protein
MNHGTARMPRNGRSRMHAFRWEDSLEAQNHALINSLL